MGHEALWRGRGLGSIGPISGHLGLGWYWCRLVLGGGVYDH